MDIFSQGKFSCLFCSALLKFILFEGLMSTLFLITSVATRMAFLNDAFAFLQKHIFFMNFTKQEN
jgi:hypothetical protein